MSLDRFVTAQNYIYDTALTELKSGRKRTHWIWFVFPQIAGLGHSHRSQVYALQSLEEAQVYLAHPLLGPRLRDCTRAVLDAKDWTAHEIFGSPDDIKFRSSMTLFDLVSPNDIFRAALEKYFNGDADLLTLQKLR